eukprot:1870750-Prymnesium_polylepis.1
MAARARGVWAAPLSCALVPIPSKVWQVSNGSRAPRPGGSTAAAQILAHAAGRRCLAHAGSTPSRDSHPRRRIRHEA